MLLKNFDKFSSVLHFTTLKLLLFSCRKSLRFFSAHILKLCVFSKKCAWKTQNADQKLSLGMDIGDCNIMSVRKATASTHWYDHGQICNCQSGIYNSTSNRLGLYCQVTIWPRKHKRRTPSQAFTRSKKMCCIGRSLQFCVTVHWRHTFSK